MRLLTSLIAILLLTACQSDPLPQQTAPPPAPAEGGGAKNGASTGRPGGPVTTPPAPAPVVEDPTDSLRLQNLDASQISISILDADKLKTLINNDKMIIMGEKIGFRQTMRNEIAAGGTACSVYSTNKPDAAASMQSGLEIKAFFNEEETVQGERSLTLIFTSTFGLKCLKSSTAPFNVRDLRDSFRNALTVSITQ